MFSLISSAFLFLPSCHKGKFHNSFLTKNSYGEELFPIRELNPLSEIKEQAALDMFSRIQTRIINVNGENVSSSFVKYSPGMKEIYDNKPIGLLCLKYIIIISNVLLLYARSAVLLHGFDSSFLEFRRLVPLLSDKHELFIPDILGWGFIGSSQADVSPIAKLNHLKTFIKEVIGGPCILVGASLGGTIAINLATEICPDLIDELILIDPQV